MFDLAACVEGGEDFAVLIDRPQQTVAGLWPSETLMGKIVPRLVHFKTFCSLSRQPHHHHRPLPQYHSLSAVTRQGVADIFEIAFKHFRSAGAGKDSL